MVQGKWFPMGSDLSAPMSVRRRVFGQGQDALDSTAWQVAVYRDEEIVGSARLWWSQGAFFLGMVGVLPKERGKGYGDLLVRLLLFKALTHNACLIALDTPPETEAFFAAYGFQATGGASGLIHMSIQGDQVCLSHCGGHCEDCQNRTEKCTPKALR